MFSRFDCWKYGDNSNCWDFVREYLIQVVAIPESDLPRFGICPKNKKAMTVASKGVIVNFIQTPPMQHSIACHYRKNTLIHVGIVDGDYVRHTSSKRGTVVDTIRAFESQSPITKYLTHTLLCQS